MTTTPVATSAWRRRRSVLRDGVAKVAELAATPLVPSDFIDLLSPLRSNTSLRGRVIAVQSETPDAATITIQPGRSWRTHTPGQYVRVGVDVDGVRLWRAYSLTSGAVSSKASGFGPPAPITITVKAIAGGVVSNHLVRSCRIGTILQLEPAVGEFSYPSLAPAKTLFISAGSGITPIMGMLRESAALRSGADVIVVHSSPTPQDTIFGIELRQLADSGRITLIERHTTRDGRLTVPELAELVNDLHDRETWACGPGEMLDSLEQNFEAAGRTDLLHTERFRPRVIALPDGDGGLVTFSRSAVSVDTTDTPAATLLDAGESAGVLMPSGCRMGICFGCVVPLREGVVRDLRTGDLTAATPGDGVLIQTCISAAAGPCHIDL